MLRRVLAVLATLIATPALASTEVDLSFNDDNVRGVFRRTLTGNDRDGSHWDAGYLHTADSDWVGHASLKVHGAMRPDGRGLRVEAGGRAVLASVGELDAVALALGGRLRFIFPSADRFVLSLEGFASPEVLTGGDATGYDEVTARFEYEILTSAAVFVGWRQVQVEIENVSPRVELEEDVHLGMAIRF